MTNLTKIANKHKTDKGTVAYEAHGYTEEYGKYIPNMGNYKLLEVGIWHGDSLRMWNDYNPDMKVVGLDIDESCMRYLQPTENVEVYIGNAANKDFVDKVIDEAGKEYDFIIDDGSHNFEDILGTFEQLYPLLVKGGYYFIEDLHATPSGGYQKVLDNILSPDLSEATVLCEGKLLVIKK